MSVDVSIRADIKIEPDYDRRLSLTIDAGDDVLAELTEACFDDMSVRSQNYLALKLAQSTDAENTETIISELFDDLPWERQVAMVRNLNASVQVFHEDPNDD